jgi:Fe-S cluster assembly iron-binding protein IscA
VRLRGRPSDEDPDHPPERRGETGNPRRCRCGRRRSLTITISDRFEYDLRFDARTESDIAVDCGAMTILLDPPSAQRADGLSVDVVTGPDDSGIDNPNQPPGVRQLSAPELKAMIESGRPFELVDVRTEEERAIAKIEGSRLLDADGHRYLLGLDRNMTVVFSATTASAASPPPSTFCVKASRICTTCGVASTPGPTSWIRPYPAIEVRTAPSEMTWKTSPC